jgi:capsular exopolysaccharide synthesis family protein
MERKKNRKDSENYQRVMTPDSPFAVKEAYVKIRTGLMFAMTSDGTRSCKTFAVTSPNQNEGKSTTAANVAISFAMLGKKTLIIDADMRKPTQKKLWNINPGSGICDFLAGMDKCETYQVEEIPLTVICTGTLPPNPSELLASERMKNLVSCLAGVYDYIIIDTPPINTVADAQIVSTYVDGVIVVTRSGSTKGAQLEGALESVKQAGGNVSGVIINGVSLKTGAYSYKRYGKYGYSDKTYYKYGYTEQKK